jgi:hypothetical protein
MMLKSLSPKLNRGNGFPKVFEEPSHSLSERGSSLRHMLPDYFIYYLHVWYANHHTTIPTTTTNNYSTTTLQPLYNHSTTTLQPLYNHSTTPNSTSFNMTSTNTVPPAPVMTCPNKGFGQRAAKTSTVVRRVATESPASPEIETVLSAKMEERIFAIGDLRKETQQDRAELLKGPAIAITVDGKIIDTLPFRLFLAASYKAREMYVTEGRTISSFSVSKSVDKASVKVLLHYMKEVSSKKTGFSLKPSQDGSIAEDLALLTAADDLGMRRYVNNICRFWHKIIIELGRSPTLEQLSAVEKYCPAMMDDRVFKAVANRMAHDLLDEIVDFRSFHQHDADFPKLHGAVLNVYAGLAAAKAERIRHREERAAFVAEKKAAAAKEKSYFAKETADREAAKKAMNMGSGVKSITAEEAAFFIRR